MAYEQDQTAHNFKSKMAIVDLSTDAAQVISSVPAVLEGIYVDTGLSAHACPILDDTTTKFSLVASLAAGTMLKFPNPIFNKLTVNSNDAATGVIVVFYREV